MSTNITLKVADEMSLKEVKLILIRKINMQPAEITDSRISGVFDGGDVGIYYPDQRSQQLCDEMYGVIPKTVINFGVDRRSTYSVSYGNILDGIIALVKTTHKDAIAAVEDRPFLRRLNGQITLYNNEGLFDASVVPQWRPRFDFEHAFKEKFER